MRTKSQQVKRGNSNRAKRIQSAKLGMAAKRESAFIMFERWATPSQVAGSLGVTHAQAEQWRQEWRRENPK